MSLGMAACLRLRSAESMVGIESETVAFWEPIRRTPLAVPCGHREQLLDLLRVLGVGLWMTFTACFCVLAQRSVGNGVGHLRKHGENTAVGVIGSFVLGRALAAYVIAVQQAEASLLLWLTRVTKAFSRSMTHKSMVRQSCQGRRGRSARSRLMVPDPRQHLGRRSLAHLTGSCRCRMGVMDVHGCAAWPSVHAGFGCRANTGRVLKSWLAIGV